MPKETPRPNVSNGENKPEFRRLARELSKAREQQAATSEVLKAISRSTFDLRTVLDTLLQSAVRLCSADQGTVAQRKGDTFYRSVSYGFSPVYLDYVKDIPVEPGRDTGTGRALLEGKVIHIPDVLPDPDFTWKEGQRLGGFRTVLGVPMLREGVAVGVLALTRSAVPPFSDEQIAMVENFALSGCHRHRERAIAQRTARAHRLTSLRRLEQQTATSDVLQVISSTPGDLQPVFATMLENAVRICDANFGNIYRWDGDALRLVASQNAPPVFAEARRLSAFRPSPRTPTGRMIANKKVVHTADLRAEQAYADRDPWIVAGVELGGVRTVLMVPMLREDELIGALSVYRQEVRPFTEKQIALVENFAAQAVIAIENARLLNEIRQSLEQQTATAQVLQVISRSTGNLAHVFTTMLENATSICQANFGTLYLKEGDGFRATATHNAPPAYEEARAQVVHPSPHTTLWQAANSKRPVQIADVTLEQGYSEGDPFVLSAVKLGGYRSVLSVPLLHEDEAVGVISIFRQEASSFSDEHVSLLQNFAAQAVIAIENARLWSDLRERTQELSALNEQLEQRVADQVGEIERMGRLRRFLPPQVADLIVASGSEKQLESHRREITALFCDLRGFTGFTESADAEDVMALLRDYHAAIDEIIIKYNGTLERYAGDGVMVVFNDPVPEPVGEFELKGIRRPLAAYNVIGAAART